MIDVDDDAKPLGLDVVVDDGIHSKGIQNGPGVLRSSVLRRLPHSHRRLDAPRVLLHSCRESEPMIALIAFLVCVVGMLVAAFYPEPEITIRRVE